MPPSPKKAPFRQAFDPASVPADRFKDNNDILLFMHIPKTAGMSVGASLQPLFDDFHSVEWDRVNQSFRARTERALHNRQVSPRRQIIIGHFSWAELNIWRNNELPMKCASIIREPLARFVSNYNYNRSPSHPNAAQFRERFPTMESFAKTLPLNYQLKLMIGLHYDFDHACKKLQKYYSFIGLTEHLNASLTHLARSHGLSAPPKEERVNVGKYPKRQEIPDSVRNIVLERSILDTKLHNRISRFYEQDTSAN